MTKRTLVMVYNMRVEVELPNGNDLDDAVERAKQTVMNMDADELRKRMFLSEWYPV